ncbi:MAG TPA: Smr/MutS family protein [Paracoccaceae bacterium]|nr:Smr/MutS family protein [Paracoccaceae bacterium]
MAKKIKGRVPPMLVPAARAPVAPTGLAPGLASTGQGLDSHWDRRLARSSTEPDFTLDLHGHTLEQAHRRLDDGLLQAKAMGARLVLVITGKPRAAEAADRGDKRGAIRAKVLDWLAAGPHGSDIASIRAAQRKHGGEGAIYLVLRRTR